jgi:hypothetical protein
MCDLALFLEMENDAPVSGSVGTLFRFILFLETSTPILSTPFVPLMAMT